jgi:hypothetical protein
MKDKNCKKCNKYYECQVMQHRFNVKKCEVGHEVIANTKHHEEVEKRAKLLERLGITWS